MMNRYYEKEREGGGELGIITCYMAIPAVRWLVSIVTFSKENNTLLHLKGSTNPYFIYFHCILLTLVVAFGDFESLLCNFGLIETASKLGNFGLGDGKS
jgi:hypothetical protein